MVQVKIAVNEVLLKDVATKMPEEMSEFFTKGGILWQEWLAARQAVQWVREDWLERLEEWRRNTTDEEIGFHLDNEIRSIKRRLRVPLKTKEELREDTKWRVRQHRDRKKKASSAI